MLLDRYIPSATTAVMIGAASLVFSCEPRETELQAGYTIQPQQTYDSRKKENDAAFLIHVANDALLEAQLAELAVRKAVSPKVKEFAISVLTERHLAANEISEIASRINIELPEEMSKVHRQHFVTIGSKKGLKFDNAFCDFIYLNNTMALKRFEKIAQEGNSDELKDWAWGKLGILKRHIAMARDFENGGSNSVDGASLIE